MDQKHIDIVKATTPVVEPLARDITEHFYPLMFERYPAVKDYFNQSHQVVGSQRQAVANAFIAYAKNIERLDALGDAVAVIAHKHCSLGIQPEQYPIVGECLLEAIAHVLGDAATEEVMGAWEAAFHQLADILISVEAGIYQANNERLGGWRGERRFTLIRKVVESEVISSFYLLPESGEKCIDFQPGQYIGVMLTIDGQVHRRNYSLSARPGLEGLRISVKREPNGVVSNYLHDQLKEGDTLMVGAPCGEFVLNDSDRPLVLVTGGVGITPAISMLDTTIASGREIVFVHAALNGRVHAFREHLERLASTHDNLKLRFVYEAPGKDDVYHAEGYIKESMLAELLPENHDVDFYFLGPKPFMKAVNRMAENLSIPPKQVHYEFFGPLESLH